MISEKIYYYHIPLTATMMKILHCNTSVDSYFNAKIL